MKVGVVSFPGSNCDEDALLAIVERLDEDAVLLWHKDHDLQGADVIILPGGFSYGDYLRSGAIARFSPIMQEVLAHAKRGGPVIGICNGFQILQESGLLPGAMLRNRDLKFHCEYINMRVEQSDTPFTALCRPGQVLHVPIAHGEGNFFAEPAVIDELERERRVIFRYTTASGDVTDAANPNGSVNNIAGICNAARNVVGLMPHPERACERSLGSEDGLVILKSVTHALATRGALQAV